MRPQDQDIEQIKEIVNNMSQRYERKDGTISFAGVDEGVVKVAPDGFCWR
jgi:hypothetical protein